MPNSQLEWPVASTVRDQAKTFLQVAAQQRRALVACHSDADGLTSGVIVQRTLERLGAAVVDVVPSHRGEHVHTLQMRARLLAHEPGALVVTDMGMRAGEILLGVPTMVIDHHRPVEQPKAALVVNGYDREPVATSSLLAWTLASDLIDTTDLDWLALVGTVGDLGELAAFPQLADRAARYTKTSISETVALLNAARRAPADDVETALEALQRASSPAAIAKGESAESERLRGYRAEVAAEVTRCAKVAPLISGEVALIAFRSRAQVHPLVAVRWRGRLKGNVVMVANEGYLPGRVNFVVRSALPRDLLHWLQERAPADAGEEFAQGHAQATGGSLTREQFLGFAESLGFESSRLLERWEPVPEGR